VCEPNRTCYNRAVTLYSGCLNRHKISLDSLAIIKSTRFLRHILVEQLAAMFLIRWLKRNIKNKAVSYIKSVARNSSNALSSADFSLNYQVTIVDRHKSIVILVVDPFIDKRIHYS
jgi:hypothetical protein